MAKQFVNADLYFKRSITILLIEFQICLGDEWDLLIWCFGTKHVTQGDVLEALGLSNIIVIGLDDLLARMISSANR